MRTVAALLAAGALGLSACSGGSTAPAAAPTPSATVEEVQGPERVGERSEVLAVDAGGYAFTVSAQDSVDGLCVDLVDAAGLETLGCGFEVPARQDLGFFVHEADDDRRVVVGTVLAEAAGVRVELTDGTSVEASLAPVADAAEPVGVFAADLGPAAQPVSVVALAADGSELGRRDV